jgi:hypothetical protein
VPARPIRFSAGILLMALITSCELYLLFIYGHDAVVSDCGQTLHICPSNVQARQMDHPVRLQAETIVESLSVDSRVYVVASDRLQTSAGKSLLPRSIQYNSRKRQVNRGYESGKED